MSEPTRLDVLKTYKLFIDGKFPRTESGRTMIVHNRGGEVLAHACKASRKDLREAVESARRAQTGWSTATPYLRGQIVYRIAEMLEGRRAEFVETIDAVGAAGGAKAKKPARAKLGAISPAQREVTASTDRLVAFAGWADKYAQVLGCNNPVAGPYYNFTVPEPTGVVAVVCPDELPLLGLVSLVAPVICAGNAAVVIASEANPLPAAILGEVLATGDLPGGVVNILTGERKELLPFVSGHRDIDAVHAAGLSAEESKLLREGCAENVKRVCVRAIAGEAWFDAAECHNPWWIEPFVEMKTMWHPASV